MFAAKALPFLLLSSLLPAQQWTTVPREFSVLPGNTALSLPARWSRGVLQVVLDADMLGDVEGRTITHLRLRRPAFPEEGAYPARQVTLTVRMAPAVNEARFISGFLDDNRHPEQLQTVFGPALVNIPASQPGQETAVGAPLLTLPLSTPFTVTTEGPRGVMVEIETGTEGQAQDVDTGNWVDAIWWGGARDRGMPLVMGHSCGDLPGVADIVLEPSFPNGSPSYDEPFSVRIQGAPPNSLVTLVVRSDLRRDEDPLSLQRLGQDLINLGLPGCRLWMAGPAPGSERQERDPFGVGVLDGDQLISGTADPAGGYSTSVEISSEAGGAVLGRFVTMQALLYTPRGGMMVTNGLGMFLGQVPLEDHASMILVPDEAEFTSWPPRYSGTPIFEFGW